MISLSDALKTGRLSEFIEQEEARGAGPASKRKLDAAIKELATTLLPPKDQTSRSTSRDGSRGK
jgi:hypothetical protein